MSSSIARNPTTLQPPCEKFETSWGPSYGLQVIFCQAKTERIKSYLALISMGSVSYIDTECQRDATLNNFCFVKR